MVQATRRSFAIVSSPVAEVSSTKCNFMHDEWREGLARHNRRKF
jgi:hypothetical protein